MLQLLHLLTTECTGSVTHADEGHDLCADSLQAASFWLYIVPWGLGRLLTWITKRYNRPQLFITENGELWTVGFQKLLIKCWHQVRGVFWFSSSCYCSIVFCISTLLTVLWWSLVSQVILAIKVAKDVFLYSSLRNGWWRWWCEAAAPARNAEWYNSHWLLWRLLELCPPSYEVLCWTHFLTRFRYQSRAWVIP